jgi:transglutaminase-like putative cysteine protease
VLEPVQFVVIFGIILGVLLGKSIFPGRIVLWMALLFSIFFVPWQLGTLFDQMLWEKRLSYMAEKLVSAIYEVSQNRPVRDPFLFVTVMSVLFWAFSLLAAYRLTRDARPWVPLGIAGLALLLIDFYNPAVENRMTYGAVFVLFCLLLVGRLYFVRQRREWERKEIEFDQEAGFDQGRLLVVAGALLVFICWNIPSFVDLFNPGSEIRSEFDQTLDDLRNRIGNAMAGLETAAVSRSDVYGPSFTLGQGGPLGEDLVFTAQLTEPKPATVRLYWVGRTYEYYDGEKWTSEIDARFPGLPGRWPFARPAYVGRTLINMNVIPAVDLMSTIYSPNLPIYSSHPVKVVAEEVSPDGSQGNISALVADPPVRSGYNFRLQAWVTNVSIEQLRAAGEDYPTWVVRRYLQLPQELPTRVVELAQRITQGAETPYDKAQAITEYLRQNITYVQAVPPVPEYHDMVDWFLFDQRTGFCNYYASAEVVLLRAVGVPARLAVGFAEGESEIVSDEFTVLRKHGHAWPEVFFPGVGWVEFEPTVTYPEIERPVTPADVNNPDGTANPEEDQTQPDETEASRGRSFATPFSGGTPLVWVWVTFVLIIGGSSTGLWLWTRRNTPELSAPLAPALERFFNRFGWRVPEWLKARRRSAELQPVERLFTRVGWMLKLLGKPVDASQTPQEQARMLAGLLPQTREPIQILLDQYQRSIFGPYLVDLEQAQRAHWLLWRIVLPVWLRRKLHLS